ncbi:hypothetical protein [Streptomyces fagopyri]|uniref:hypothetical protein n=1 Tax=Streptomyces fagopyri TaxID=2662397 RepID=UPI003717FA12
MGSVHIRCQDTTPRQAPGEGAALARSETSEPSPLDTVAYVLQGGESVYASQVGALRALTRAGITPDLVVGSSADALDGVAPVAGPSIEGTDRLEALWVSLNALAQDRLAQRAAAVA